MNNNFNTSQPVAAKSSTRLLSAFIDYLVMVAIEMVLFIPVTISNINSYSEQDSDFAFNPLGVSIMLGTIYFYFFCKDMIGGRSIGKRIMKLQLVRNSKPDVPVSPVRMVIRNLFIMLWFVEFFVYLANPRQRLGDIVTDTVVVAATDDNRQETNVVKTVLTMLVVALLVALAMWLYYGLLMFLMDFLNMLFHKMTLGNSSLMTV